MSTFELVYKSCHPYIVTLQKLSDTKTNEDRPKNNVVSQYARYRADKLLVVSIKHKFTEEEINEIENTMYEIEKIKYIKGDVMCVKDYDSNDKICGKGIHYYKNKECAYYIEIKPEENNYTGDFKSWYANGMKEIETTYTNGKINGNYLSYYNDGKTHIDENYIDGNKEGLSMTCEIINECSRYDNKNVAITECTYKNGKKNGSYKKWQNNHIIIDSAYKNDLIDGPYKIWDTNGHIMIETIYKDGLIDGPYKEWDNNGHNIIETTYKDGKLNGTFKRWNDKGYIERMQMYKDGLIDGVFDTFYENGKKKFEVFNKNGKRDGSYKKWLENGKQVFECNFTDDMLNGLLIIWDANGKLINKCIYDNFECDDNFISLMINYKQQ